MSAYLYDSKICFEYESEPFQFFYHFPDKEMKWPWGQRVGDGSVPRSPLGKMGNFLFFSLSSFLHLWVIVIIFPFPHSSFMPNPTLKMVLGFQRGMKETESGRYEGGRCEGEALIWGRDIDARWRITHILKPSWRHLEHPLESYLRISKVCVFMTNLSILYFGSPVKLFAPLGIRR